MVIAIVLAIPLIFTIVWKDKKILLGKWWGVFLLLPMIITILLWIDLFFLTTINGHNLCGEIFDNYIVGSYLVERSIPVIIIGISIGTTTIGALFLNRNKNDIK